MIATEDSNFGLSDGSCRFGLFNIMLADIRMTHLFKMDNNIDIRFELCDGIHGYSRF